MLQWLNDLFLWAAKVVPRLVVVTQRNAGVAFVRGKNVRLWQPGLHLYWPVWTDYIVYPTCLQTVNLAEQTLVSSDGKTVAVNGIVVLKIADPVTLFVEVYEPDRMVRDFCLTAVKRVVCERTLDELLDDHSRIDRMLTGRMRRRLSPYGIQIVRAALSDIAPCRVWKLWGITQDPTGVGGD